MIARLAAIALAAAAACPTQAQEALATPRIVIYPRQTISADMLELRDDVARRIGAPLVADPSEAIGKVSRVTLLPGRPIPVDALAAPNLVQMGAAVELRFRSPGVDIRAAGVALQAAAAGERLRVRNAQTAVVVTGVLRADGAVIVEETP